MNTYEISIVNVTDKSEISTFEVTAEDIATLSINLETVTNYAQTLELELADGTYLHIDQNSEYGFNADLYGNLASYENGEAPVGGGLCTGTLSDAVEMALLNR